MADRTLTNRGLEEVTVSSGIRSLELADQRLC